MEVFEVGASKTLEKSFRTKKTERRVDVAHNASSLGDSISSPASGS
jgi:hypothetical protein